MTRGVEDHQTQRLFVAVRPNDDVATALAELPRSPLPGVRWVEPAHWHLTLRFLPAAEPSQVVAALDDAVMRAAVVTLGPAVTTFADRVVVLPASGLEPLAAAVLDATRHLGPVDSRPFRGHLTLARTPNGVSGGIVGRPFWASFTAETVELISSDPSDADNRYRTIASWRLPGSVG